MINSNLGYWFYVLRKYDDAEKVCLNVLEMDEGFAWAHLLLGLIYIEESRYEQAIDELKTAAVLSDNTPEFVAYLAYAYAMAGMDDETKKILEGLLARSEQDYVPPTYFALINIGLGENDKAFEWLENAYEVRDYYLTTIPLEPTCDPIRKDERFRRLFTSIGFEPSLLSQIQKFQ
jgi:tetratricopeptide (TPR) repeat protein